MTDPNWKPQPGKPAMTRDEKTLVTDLEDAGANWVWSESMNKYWTPLGYIYTDQVERPRDLIEPTAAILADHGIDADGKPLDKPEVYVADYKKIDGTYDYFVMLRCGDREMSLRTYHTRNWAEYEAAKINQIFNGGPLEDFEDFDI
jgi:hypothetical protein